MNVPDMVAMYDHVNFQDFGTSLLTCYVMSTGENCLLCSYSARIHAHITIVYCFLRAAFVLRPNPQLLAPPYAMYSGRVTAPLAHSFGKLCCTEALPPLVW